MKRKTLTVCVLVAFVVAAMPVQSFAATASSPMTAATAPVLPEGVVMDDAELAEVEGAVLKTAAVGALAGLVTYGVGQLYDGVVHGDWSWSWADAGKAVVTGAVAGAIGKLF